MSDLSPHSIPLPERGWTPERKAQFLDYLSERGNVASACKRVGLSREAAYRQRRRDATFARGWAAALVLAHDANVEVLADRAIEGIEVEVWHRGEMVGTQRKHDTRLFLAHLARLDKAAEDTAAQRDAGRFDELLACIAGEKVPVELRGEDDVLPLDREESARAAAARVEDGLRYTTDENGEAALREPQPDEDACYRAYVHGRWVGHTNWDNWFANACDYVDWLSGWDDGIRVEPMSPGPDDEDEDLADVDAYFEPRTVSEVSTGCDGQEVGRDDADPDGEGDCG